MGAQQPAGPSRFLVGTFVIGVGLLFWAIFVPSVHAWWQVILGALMCVASVGKMVAR
jgi:hypothetical protein